MPRIVAGQARGRRLRVPDGVTRPTSDRVREAVFSTLAHELGDWGGVRVLDLYAGSGALGLEAASRGAAQVVLVERDRRAVAVARANADQVSPDGRAKVLAMPVRTFLAGTPTQFDLVFLDPPYELAGDEVQAVLDNLAAAWLTPGAIVVVERASRGAPLRWPPSLLGWAHRAYSGTTVWYGLYRPGR